jgi:hypothetical protein
VKNCWLPRSAEHATNWKNAQAAAVNDESIRIEPGAHFPSVTSWLRVRNRPLISRLQPSIDIGDSNRFQRGLLNLGASGITAPAYWPSIRSSPIPSDGPSVSRTSCAMGSPTGSAIGTLPRLLISRVKQPR